jgi:hypothetical protein
MDFSNDAPASTAAPTPVVLRIMPLLGSAAPIGYIYNPQPTLDGKGGLLAAAAAFFSHQGHQIFYDPCPDLAAYCTGWGVTATIINVDQLPNHVLSAGLDLLDATPSPPNADALGMSFMATYLPVLAPAAPLGNISPSPMGGNPLHGRTFSINCHGGSRGSAHLLYSAPPPFSAPIGPPKLAAAFSHPPASHARQPCLDPKPDMIASNFVQSLGLGRFPSSIHYGGLHGGQSTRSISLHPPLVIL